MSDEAPPPPALRIALLQCGHVHPEVAAAHGDYPELFADLLDGHWLELTTIDVTEGALPEVGAFDGWLVSGSASSTYEPLPWIPAVEDLLRTLIEAEAPLVAVCFGHQLLAQAMGGEVARAEGGWGAGVHRYELTGPAAASPPPWMAPAPAEGTVSLIASHQDQVVALPPGAEVWLRTDHCPVAGYALGPAALAIQPHPEFTAPVSRGLVERRTEVMGPPVADAALASLDVPIDRRLVGTWMAQFLRLALAR